MNRPLTHWLLSRVTVSFTFAALILISSLVVRAVDAPPPGAAAAATPTGAAKSAVRVWQGTQVIPSYEEDPPSVNPPFDLFTVGRFNYPYTIRDNLTPRKIERTWRTLNLENEYLKLVVLPDFGGHVYSCTDKTNGAQMFYANPSLKLAKISYRGAWAAFGVEFNFPVSHNWASASPVDFGQTQYPDGSAGVWVGNIDRPYGMQWRIELKMKPGESVLEESIWLYNRSDVRHRFYWWNNAATEVWADSHIIMPTRFTAAHGFANINTWPVDSEGKDNSIVGNHDGPMSTFIHASREPYLGVYHPHTNAGVIHYAPTDQTPGRKVYSWGWGSGQGADLWMDNLSDNHSAYIELQAGLFRNQETYAFLEPQQTLHFHEYWLPIRDIGGVSRANLNGAVNIERASGAKALKIGVNLTRPLSAGVLRIKQGDQTVAQQPLAAGPDKPAIVEVAVGAKGQPEQDTASPYTVQVLDAAGKVLIEQTEGKYDWEPERQVKAGQQQPHKFPDAAQASEGDLVEQGQSRELVGDLLGAWRIYTAALVRFPDSLLLNKAIGRLAVALKRYDDAIAPLTLAANRYTPDPETHYYLGLTWVALGDDEKARAQFEMAQLLPLYAPAAHQELGRLAARQGDIPRAIKQFDIALQQDPQATRTAAMRVALLRVFDQTDAAKAALPAIREIDPLSPFVRCEAVKLTGDEAAAKTLWAHLAGDPERIVEVAVDYMELGLYRDALELLSREYSTEGVVSEPGWIHPSQYPIIAYYRGYCRLMTGGDGMADFKTAAAQPIKYVFPNRPMTAHILRRVMELNPTDANARFFLGCLALSGGDVDSAIGRWREALTINPHIPTLHQSLGTALLIGKDQPSEALKVFLDGMADDPANTDLYVSAERLMNLLGRPISDRVTLLEKYPDRAHMPPTLVYALAVAQMEAGKPQDAAELFVNRYFPPEEFGVDVREIYLEVQLQQALSLAKAGNTEQALAVADRMTKPSDKVTFTSRGMKRFVESARFQFYWGEILAQCGKTDAAHEHYQAAATARNGELPWTVLAQKRLGQTLDVPALKLQWQTTLDEFNDAQGRQTQTRVWLLRAVGRESEARAVMLDSFKSPNRGLRHYLIREAMRMEVLE